MVHRMRWHNSFVAMVALMLLSACGATQPVAVSNTPTATPIAQSSVAAPAVVETPITSTIAEPSITPTLGIIPTPSIAPTPTETNVAAQPVQYFWPTNLPADLEPRPAKSHADATGFVFETTVAEGYGVTLMGGTPAANPGVVTPQDAQPGQLDLPKEYTIQNIADCLRGITVSALCPDTLRTIEVRGVQGQGIKANNAGAYNIFWEENGNIYALLTSLPLEQALDVANNLEVLDLPTWQARMQVLVTPTPTPTGPLVYFWPTVLPVTNPPLHIVQQGLYVTAQADTNGFVLPIESGGQWQALLAGGDEVKDFPNDTPVNDGSSPKQTGVDSVTVRGQPGFAFTTGAGYKVWWKENGQPYSIGGGISLDDVLTLAEALEPVDMQTWQQRLEAQP